ncbi:MAG: trigger factor [SAR202 cluster bacterium]|nr:trigger factor [SAR202 cluster bacterium]
MKFKQSKEKNRQVNLDVDLDDKDLEPYYKIGYKKLVKKITIPGFRKGKAPYHIIESQYGKETIISEALDNILSDKTSEAIKESSLESYMPPKIELKNFNPIKFTIILPLQPQIVLGEINKIKLEKIKDPDFESLIDEQINNLQKQFTNWIPSSEKAQSGELISINIKIEINGNSVLDQKNTDILLEEQNDEFAPGLIKNLIGLKEGDSKNLDLKISKNHPSSEMANKKANFNITVNSVKKSDSPKLDANFAKMVSNNEIKTMNTLRKKVKTSVEENHKQQSEYEYQNNAINELIKISNIELPPLMIEREIQNEIEQLENLAKRFKMTLEEYLTKNNQNLEETKKNIEIETLQKLNRTFTLLEICKQNNITPTEQELSEAEKNLIAQQSNNKNSPKLSKEEIRMEAEYRLKLEKASKYLYQETLENVV